jgi:O-antigen ligase
MSPLSGAARLRRFSLSLLALALPISLGLTNAALILLTAALLAESRIAPEASRLAVLKSPALLALGLYVLWGFADSFFGLDPAASLRFVFQHELHMLWALGLLLVALQGADAREIGTWMGLGFAAVVLMGLGQAALAFAASGRHAVFRAAHGFIHPLYYGQILALGLVAGYLALGPSREIGGRVRRALGGLVALGFLALFINQTRNAWLGLLAAALVLLLVPRGKASPAERLSIFAPLLIVGAGLWSMNRLQPGHSLSSAFSTALQAAPAASPLTADSDHTRLMLASIGWTMFMDHPWLGVGPDQFHAAYPLYYQQKLEGTSVWGDAHNFYLNTLATKGIPGLIALLSFFYLLARESWIAALKRPSWGSRLALASTACFAVMSVFEVHRQQATTLFLFLWAWGMTRSRADESRPTVSAGP